MPYKADGSDVPESVAKLSAAKRRQFAAVWNSAYKKCRADGGADGECEGPAYERATGVLKQEEEVSMPGKKKLELVEEEVAPEVEPVNPTQAAPDGGADVVTATEEEPTLNPTIPADVPPTDGGGVAPVIEMAGYGKIRELLQAALAMLADMTPADEEPTPDEEPMEAAETFAEVAALQLAEQDAPTNRRAPLRLDVGIIKVGPGNARDNHYYTDALLERDGGIFKGAKMYATDHRNDEKSVRTEVSLLEDVVGVREFADGRYLVGKAVVFNPDFAEDVRNRADAGVLDSLHCSILAKGSAKPGKVGETEYNIVQEITDSQSVDWVTRAGAGGHALQLAELAAEPEQEPEPEVGPVALDEIEAQPVTLSEDNATEGVIQPLPLAEVITELGKTNLPAASVAGLASGQYVDLSEVGAAVTAEVARLKAAGSGQPLGMAATPTLPKVKNLQEIQAELSKVNRKWTGGI